MHYSSSSQINFQGQPLFFARFVGSYSAPNNIDTLVGLGGEILLLIPKEFILSN